MDGRATNRTILLQSLKKWNKFFTNCKAARVETAKFARLAPALQKNNPLPPTAIADVFLRPPTSNASNLDPLVPLYLQTLTNLNLIDTPSILQALYKYSASRALLGLPLGQNDAEKAGEEAQRRESVAWSNSYWAEEYMFYRLTKAVVERKETLDPQAALEVVRIVSKWMTLFVAAASAFEATALGQSAHDVVRRDGMESARAAFVALLLRLCECEPFVRTITKPSAKVVRQKFSEALGKFIPTLQLVPQVTEKLEQFRLQTLAKLDPVTTKDDAASAAMNELIDSAVGSENFFVPELPISNTRAGLYIYLHAALVSRPVLDDNALFSFLNARYAGNNIDAATDLILASFDMIARAVFANEIKTEAHLLKSFLINKVPLILAQLLPPEFSGSSAEECVKKTLNQVNQELFPTASAMFDVSRNSNPYTESVREEFCAACVLHGLVSRDNLEQILGEVSMANQAGEKFSKDKLVETCMANHMSIRGIVNEIEKMDGNAGAVCQAVGEIIRQLCQQKDTMTLKGVCTQLAQKPYALDVILLFEKLPSIVQPLCQLVDDWRYEEDQGEYQPVYEEYGAILLLVSAFSHRYKLSPADLGAVAPDGATATILSKAHIARDLDSLDANEKENLNGWILGLFDSEAGGLGDDLMSSCAPRNFYLLVSTLFHQIVVAYSSGNLPEESLKGGIEYLVDTFLAPSLVPAVLFLAESLWINSGQQKSIVKVLQLILSPKSISQEAAAMLTSVKNLVAKPLEHALRTYQKRDPNNQDIGPLLDTLADNLHQSRRTSFADLKEIEKWTANPNGGLASTIQSTMGNLVSWSMNPVGNHMPHNFTYKQIVMGSRILGTKRLLYVILEAVRQHTIEGSGNIVYDIGTALVCGPDAATQSSGGKVHTLREILTTEAAECKKIQKNDPIMAETVVRLHRRVEAQLAITPPPVLQPPEIGVSLEGDAMSLGDAMAAAAVSGVQADALDVDTMALDMGMGGGDLNLGDPTNGSGLDGTSDTDLFGGLDGGDMFDGWDSMDMS